MFFFDEITNIKICQAFNSKKELFQQLGDFDRAWSLILEFIQNAALSKNGEVSLAALKSLQEVMFHNSDKTKKTVETNEEVWNVSIFAFHRSNSFVIQTFSRSHGKFG